MAGISSGGGSSGGGDSAQAGADRDTAGNAVPTWKPHAYTYDGSGNLLTDTVTDGSATWVRTYTYQNGQQVSDSGWVKNA